MFNSVDVDTMLMKRRQKFFDGYEHLDNLLCQITMSCNCNWADHHFYYNLLFCFIILLLSVLYCGLDVWNHQCPPESTTWRSTPLTLRSPPVIHCCDLQNTDSLYKCRTPDCCLVSEPSGSPLSRYGINSHTTSTLQKTLTLSRKNWKLICLQCLMVYFLVYFFAC